MDIDILSNMIKLKLNLRMKFLYYMSFMEENKEFITNDHDESTEEKIILYPRSYINNVTYLEQSKDIDYNFIGTLFFFCYL